MLGEEKSGPGSEPQWKAGGACYLNRYKALLEEPSRTRKSISPRTNVTAKRRSVLGEEKYGPGSEPQWKAGGTCYPNLCKALLEEPSRTLRTKLLEDIPSGKTGDGRNTRRPARAWIRNQ